MGKRLYPLQCIKTWQSYDIDDICALYKTHRLHPQTVRGWIKQGLPTIDKGKPTLIYGDDLKTFLGTQNQSGKRKTAFTQMFCFKCKEPQPAFQRQVTLEHIGGYVKAKAHCRACKSIMNKSYKLSDIPKLKTTFRVGDVLELYDCADSPLNTHLDAPAKPPASEPVQLEMF